MKKIVVVQVMLVALAGLLAAGCSNFKSKRGLDMGPFADNTVTMLAEAQKIVEPLDWRYLREYRTGVGRDTLMAETELLRRTFSGIGFYSIQVVSLNSSHLSGSQRSKKLSEYIDQVCRPIAKKDDNEIGLTEGRLDSVITNVRAQKVFLDALGEADPIVYPVVTYAISVVDHLAFGVKRALGTIEASITEKFAETRRETDELNALEEREVRTYLMLQDYRVGKTTLESMLGRDPSLAPLLTAKGKSREDATNDAQTELLSRLASVDTVRKQLDLKNNLYEAQKAELDDFNQEVDRRRRSAVLMLVYWMRAHRNLAQGVEIPPAIDLGAIAASSAKKATKVLP